MDLFVWSGGLKHATSLETRLVFAYGFSKCKRLFSQLKNLISYSDQYRIFIIDESGNFIKYLCPIVIFDWNLANNNYWNGRCPLFLLFSLKTSQVESEKKNKKTNQETHNVITKQLFLVCLVGLISLEKKKLQYQELCYFNNLWNCASKYVWEIFKQTFFEWNIFKHLLLCFI